MVSISAQDTVLIPEVFDNARRIEFFSRMAECELQRCRFIVYDLLPDHPPGIFHSETTFWMFMATSVRFGVLAVAGSSPKIRGTLISAG